MQASLFIIPNQSVLCNIFIILELEKNKIKNDQSRTRKKYN